MLKPEDITKERKRFTADNLSAENQSGMVIYDAKFADVKPIESKPFTVNAAQGITCGVNLTVNIGEE